MPTERAVFLPEKFARLAVCAALGVLVFGSRAWLVRSAGSPVPFWDQWDAEAFGLYGPWLRGQLHWLDLVRAHNEHRIVLTRLADLALFAGLGEWNPWAQLLLNGALHALTAAALGALFWPALPARERGVFFAGLAVLFTALAGWQNALWGFQSQVYFANLLTVAAIAGLVLARPGNAGWAGGWVAAVLALGANGSGLLAPAAVLAATALPAARTERPPGTRRAWFTVAMLVAAGLALHSTVPGHAALQARSVGQFFAVFTQALAWPWVDQGAWCLVMQLPLAWLVCRRARGAGLDNFERAALGLGIFALLQAAAIAYSRGGGLTDARPLSRYQDPLLLGAAAQLFAALRLWSASSRPARLAVLAWGGATLAGLLGLTVTNLTLHLPYKRVQDQAGLQMVRTYLATGDATVFHTDPRLTGPHPDADAVRRVLDDPALRAVLPADLRAPADSGAPVPPGIIRIAPVITVLGAGLLALLVWFSLRPEKSSAERSVRT